MTKKLFGTIKNVSERYDNIDSAKRYYEASCATSHRTARLNKEFKLVEEFISQLPKQKTKFLDIGCSGGRYLELALKYNGDVFGIDTSINALKYAQELNNGAFLSQASVTHLPFAERTFDLVICIELLHHFEDSSLERILDEIERVMKPNGILIFDIRNSYNPLIWRSYRKRDGIHFPLKARSLFKMSKMLEKRGLKVIDKKPIFFPLTILAPYAMIFSKKSGEL